MFDLDSTFADLFGTSDTCKKCGKKMIELTCNCQPVTIKVDEEFERKQRILDAFESDDSGHN